MSIEYMSKEGEIVVKTAYGAVWKEGTRFYATFTGHDGYPWEISEDETVEHLGYTLQQTFGSWGPTQEFRRHLEERGWKLRSLFG